MHSLSEIVSNCLFIYIRMCHRCKEKDLAMHRESEKLTWRCIAKGKSLRLGTGFPFASPDC